MSDEVDLPGVEPELAQKIADKFAGPEFDEPEASSEPEASELPSDSPAETAESTDESSEGGEPPRQQPKAAPKDADVLRHNDEAMWTADEVQLITRCEAERQYLDQRIAQFNELVAQSERVDPSKRAQFELDLTLIREELGRRATALNGALDGLRKSYDGRRTARADKLRASEAEQLKKAFPDLDHGKLRDFILSRGFTEQGLRFAPAKELILAEEARRYRELMARDKQKPRKVKQVKKILDRTPSIENDRLDAAEERMRRFHKSSDVERVLTMREQRRPKTVQVESESIGKAVRDLYQQKYAK